MFEILTAHEINTKKSKTNALIFADKRLALRYEMINSSLEKGQSCILNKVSMNRAERKGSYDFFQNERVKESHLKEMVYSQMDEKKIEGGHLLVVQDSSDYNFGKDKARRRDEMGLGEISNKYGLGYIVHPSLVMDQSDNSIIGLSDIQLWSRQTDRARSGSRKQRSFEDKESYKWQVGIMNSHERLAGAEKVTYVQDRDGDIYESIVRVKSLERAELLVRNCRDRRILLEDSSQKMLHAHLSEQAVKFSYTLAVQGDKRVNRKSRIAELEVRSARVELLCPENLKTVAPAKVEVDVVWVREKESSVSAGETPIDWKLITTHSVHDKEKSIRQLIGWYVSRWKIEEFFLSQKQVGMIWKTPN